MLRGNASNAKHALPDDGKRAERSNDNATKVQMRSQVDHRQVSGEVCRAELPDADQSRRTRVLLPSRSSRLRVKLRARRKGRTRFRRPPDRRRRLLSETQGTKERRF